MSETIEELVEKVSRYSSMFFDYLKEVAGNLKPFEKSVVTRFDEIEDLYEQIITTIRPQLAAARLELEAEKRSRISADEGHADARAELAREREARVRAEDERDTIKFAINTRETKLAARCQRLKEEMKAAENEMVKKPSSEWEKRFEQDGHKIIDPDGWDRTPDGWDKSWGEPITWWEFNRRVSRSTCQWNLAARAPDQGRETCRTEPCISCDGTGRATTLDDGGFIIFTDGICPACDGRGRVSVEVPKGEEKIFTFENNYHEVREPPDEPFDPGKEIGGEG